MVKPKNQEQSSSAKNKTRNNLHNRYWLDKTKFWAVLAKKFMYVLDRKFEDYKLQGTRRVISEGRSIDDERKVMEIYEQTTAVVDHLNEILNTIKYFNLRGLNSVLKKNEVPHNDFLRFIFESHLIRVSSTPDICAKLGDLICNTGISKNRFNWYKFVTHAKIKNHPCGKIIMELIDDIDSLRTERHKLIHFGGHKNDIIKSLEQHTIDRKFLKSSPILIKYFTGERAKYVKRLEKEMTQNYRVCLKHTKSFLDSLIDELSKLKISADKSIQL